MPFADPILWKKKIPEFLSDITFNLFFDYELIQIDAPADTNYGGEPVCIDIDIKIQDLKNLKNKRRADE